MKALIALSLLFSVSASAATLASYTASAAPSSSPDANSNTANVWTVSAGGTGGSFQGNSGNNGSPGGAGSSNAGAGTSAWALYSDLNSLTEAIHTFSGGALLDGQKVSMDFDNGNVNTGGAVTGVSVRNAAGLNLFEFFFTGGQSAYSKNDSGGITSTGKAFTDDGFAFWFAPSSTAAYTANIGGTALSGNLITQTDMAPAQIRVFTYSNNGFQTTDTFFNNLAITPEPSRALLLGLGLIGFVLRRRR